MPSVYSGRRFFLGLLGDELLRATPLGLNVLLWIAAVVATLLALSRWQRAPLTGGRRWMLPVLVVFAGLLVWRDSPWLVSLDLFAIVVALTLGSLRSPRPVHRAGLSDYAVGLGYASAAVSGRPVTLMQEDIDWKSCRRARRPSRPLPSVAASCSPRRCFFSLARSSWQPTRSSRTTCRAPSQSSRAAHTRAAGGRLRLGQRRPPS